MTFPMAIFEKSFVLGKNMAFTPNLNLLPIVILQTSLWIFWIIPVCLLLHELSTSDQTFVELNQGDFDLVVLFFTFLNFLIRFLVISMKYGTMSEQLMRQDRSHHKTFEELGRGLTA